MELVVVRVFPVDDGDGGLCPLAIDELGDGDAQRQPVIDPFVGLQQSFPQAG